MTLKPTSSPTPEPVAFSGDRALADAAYQLSLGPRTVGSAAHQQVGDWITAELKQAGWEVEIRETRFQGQPVRNIIGKLGEGNPWVVIGAHYDSRMVADQDPDPTKQSLPVPGANDGASGVAVLTELARSLPDQIAAYAEKEGPNDTVRPRQIWLVFFDTEDNGKLPGWDWILGSRAFVDNLSDHPDAAVILDMIGDQDLNVYYEKYSDARLNQEFWSIANKLGYQAQFIPEFHVGLIDDHRPFLDAGIPAIDLVDFTYPYWHTTADTLDKLSAKSLQVIGDVVTAWILTGSSIFR